jgi:CRP-like cAMP-binding protein
VESEPGTSEKRVGTIQPGGFFGEMSLMTGEPRSATVVAATDAFVYEVTKEDMGALLANRPEVAEVISLAIARRRLEVETIFAANGETATALEASLARQILTRVTQFFQGVLGHSSNSDSRLLPR